jgi:hypothetical protein
MQDLILYPINVRHLIFTLTLLILMRLLGNVSFGVFIFAGLLVNQQYWDS